MGNIFVTAIGTDSGKTVISAIMCEALNYDYWKPIQSGIPTDSDTISKLTPNIKILPERYKFKLPASPHLAALNEGVVIDLNEFNYDILLKNTIVEGAGGVLVPLNDKNVVIDIAQKLNSKVVLVSNFYLGSINHTLLTVNELKSRGIYILGIIFNGNDHQNTKEIILKKSELQELLHIEIEEEINSDIISKYANEFRKRNPKLLTEG